MISKPLFRRELRSTWLLFLVFTAVMTMYVTIVLSMFDPKLGSILADFEAAMPGVMAAFGMTGAAGTDLTAYASSYLFGFIMLLFPILLAVILSNRLVAKYVDSGSMAYLLASPNTRRKIITTQGAFLWLCIALLVALLAGIGVVFCQLTFPGELDIKSYVLLHVGVLGLHTLVAGVGFCASCVFNETKWSYTIGAGIPLAGYILQMIANMGGRYEALQYLTFFSLFSPERILAGDGAAVWMTAMLYLAGLALFLIGGWRFTKRNLPL